MTKTNLHYWLATLYLKNIGPVKILKWLEYFHTIENLFLANEKELKQVGLNEQQIAAVKNPDWKSVAKDLEWVESTSHSILTWDDINYPALLKEIYAPPLALFIRGNQAALHHLQLAMVGSRYATPNGLRNAEQFAFHLAGSGLAITSGLALGIDGASHRGALNAKGITVGVAGTGLGQMYPVSNRQLADEIITNQGVIISEFPPQVGPHAANFPRRNRLISGLSIGVLVVEAAIKSGSLITAKYALEQGRDVFAIPGSIHQPMARGCHYLIRQGAKLVETANDILEEISVFDIRKRVIFLKGPPPGPQALADNMNDFRQILEQIGYEMTPIDMIILQSGLTPGEVSSILLKLELQGYIQSVAGGYIRVAPIR